MRHIKSFSAKIFPLVFKSRLLILFLFLDASTLIAQRVTIDFDDLRSERELISQLFPKGVIFPYGVYIYKNSATEIGISSQITEFDPNPITIEFISKVSFVSINASVYHPGNTTAILKAFDINNRLVAQDGPRNITNNYGGTQFSIQLPNVIIKRVQLQAAGEEFEIIDKLIFEGDHSQSQNINPPSLNILANIQPETYTEKNKLIINGNVTGESLLPTVKILIDYNHPPFDHSGQSIYTINLLNHSFSFTLPNPPIGPMKIQVITQNISGGIASETREIQNIPEPITTQFNAEHRNHQEETYGNFLWGMREANNILVVYDHLAILETFLRRPGYEYLIYSTLFVKDPILSKWINIKDQTDKLKLGLPVSGQTTRGVNAISQDFKEGRIYSHNSFGLHYVPKVFSTAIDKLGGELGCGFPIMDPEFPLGTNQDDYTWLFQKFQRIDKWKFTNELLPTTLEIKGRIPKLYIERQGGDLVLENTIAGVSPGYIRPTIYEVYNCDGIYGPCHIELEHQARLNNPGRFCRDGKSYEEKLNDLNAGLKTAYAVMGLTYGSVGLIPTRGISNFLGVEWPSIVGDNVLTNLSGIIIGSHLANSDLPWSHTNHFDPCPVSPGLFPGSAGRMNLTTFKYLLATVVKEKVEFELGEPVNGDILALQGDPVCPSDWNLHVVPFRNYEKLLGPTQTSMEVEIEDYFFRPFRFFTVTDPLPGDVIFTAGRWIIDCGHSDFNTEIHPPAVMAIMRGVKYANHDATVAFVEINNFYTGKEVTFNIYPPPRPSTKAHLNITVPLEKYFYKLKHIENMTNGYLQLTFSSTSAHTSSVSDFGELKWSWGGGHYRGNYYVYWSE